MGFERAEFNPIVIEDRYKVKHFVENSLDYIFDIGANKGVFSVFMRMKHPKTSIIAIEPTESTFNELSQNIKGLNIFIEKVALADGSPMYRFTRGVAVNDFYTKEESKYKIDTITLSDLFIKYHCTKSHKYMIKSDCEGGEKYLIGDTIAEDILKNAEQISLEVHFQSKNTPIKDWLTWEEYDRWVHKLFANTHTIEYYKSNKARGYGHYCIKKI